MACQSGWLAISRGVQAEVEGLLRQIGAARLAVVRLLGVGSFGAD